MVLGLKWSTLAERVPSRMRWIKVRAGNPAGRQRLVRRVRTTARQQFGKHMGMRPAWALAAGRRDRRVKHPAPQGTDKKAVACVGHDHFSRAPSRNREPV